MKIVQQANKEARDNARRTNEAIKRDRQKVTVVCKALQKAGVNINYVNVDGGGYNVSLTGSRADLDIVFGTLRRLGLTPDSRPAEKDTSYCTWWRAEGFRLWVWFTSTSCKRVQVGTELKEVPVYDTVCEE